MTRFDPDTEKNLRILAATPEEEIQGYETQGNTFKLTTIQMARLWVAEQDMRKIACKETHAAI